MQNQKHLQNLHTWIYKQICESLYIYIIHNFTITIFVTVEAHHRKIFTTTKTSTPSVNLFHKVSITINAIIDF